MDDRYTLTDEPWEWSCKDCSPNARIYDPALHDTWHLKHREGPVWGTLKEHASAQAG